MTTAVYRVPEVAQLLGMTPARVYELVRRRDIPCIRFGRQVRIEKLQIDALLAGRLRQH